MYPQLRVDTMMKKKIRKPPELRLRECEEHLYLLNESLERYRQNAVHYKQVASELRVLVADQKPSQRLLLAMMAEYDFSYDVQPSKEPIHARIPMVGWRDDPEHKAMCEEAEACLGDEEKIKTLVEKQAAMARPVPFAEFVERGLAVFIAPHDISNRELVAVIAQQIGSAHEGTAVDESIVKLRHIRIGNEESHIVALIDLAHLVLRVGTQFLAHVVQQHGYQLRQFQIVDRPPDPPQPPLPT